MALDELKRSVAAQALEAANAVLQHIRKWALRMKNRGEEKPRELSNLYGRVRRVRDRLDHAMEEFMSDLELDLDDEDCNVLASCVVFLLQDVGTRLSYGKDLHSSDRTWLEERRQILFDLAVELASEEIKLIPAPRTTKEPVAVVRMVMDRVRRKIRGATGTGSETETPLPEATPGAQAGLNEGRAPEVLAASAGKEHPAVRKALEQGVLSLDCRLVNDVRLRTMVALDIRAMERAQTAKDHRLAAVHLCSLCEAVVIDVALARHDKIQLKGTPDTWRLDELIGILLGDSFTTGDRANLYHLIACRSIIRPSIQLQSPIVVTEGALNSMAAFVQRLLIALGVSGSVSSSPAAAEPPKK